MRSYGVPLGLHVEREGISGDHGLAVLNMADLHLLVVERMGCPELSLHGDNPWRLTLSPRPLQRAGTCIDAFQLKYAKDSVGMTNQFRSESVKLRTCTGLYRPIEAWPLLTNGVAAATIFTVTDISQVFLSLSKLQGKAMYMYAMRLITLQINKFLRAR
uniref:Uncharacterized protein n=1 Tax=Oryza meridionalis TaxID=40149 RepID=A0A0E0DZR0_9ORYZ